MSKQTEALLQFDRDHLWHPYTSMIDPLPTYLVKKAQGNRITLSDGSELIDGMASWWSAIHGYNHPALNLALQKQTEQFSHVMFGGMTHEPAIDLARKLIAITPDPIDRIFFADSGSVAVEVAIKMALQFQIAKGHSQRNRLLTVSGGYHGDTFRAMSVSDPENGMHQQFAHVIQKQIFAPRPATKFGAVCETSEFIALEQLFERYSDEIAAVIIEPIVQGAGGMWFYSADYLNQLRKLCDQHNALLIFDEIATGFGRTGEMFALEHSAVIPDILCIGKALSGGYMTLAATMTTKDVAEGVSESGMPFMHGPTFMGNALACSVANANIALLQSYDWPKRISSMSAQLKQGLENCKESKSVADVRVLGAIGVVEMKARVDVASLQNQFIKRGIWIRPFNNLIYVMPPYITDQADIEKICRAIEEIVDTL